MYYFFVFIYRFLNFDTFSPPQITLTQKFPRIWSPYYFWCPIPPLQYDYKAPSVTYSPYILTWSTFIRLRRRCYIEICHKSWKKLCDSSLTFLFRKKVVICMLLQLLSAYLFFSPYYIAGRYRPFFLRLHRPMIFFVFSCRLILWLIIMNQTFWNEMG